MGKSSQDLMNSESIREQAEPYRLATAKFPINALTCKWGVGSNRPIDEKHVQNLCRIFQEQGLQRETAENHLLVTCTRAEAQNMIDFLKQAGRQTRETKSSLQQLCFDDWMLVNRSEAEIMAGQHRIAALKLYLQQIGSHPNSPSMCKDQAWWICDIYDKDRLPTQLKIRLRANRQSSSLPDSHGQVWMELATLASADQSMFRGDNGPVQEEILGILGLSGRTPFPIRRLVTLWKNNSWRPMITWWCQTSIGRDIFNVSLWEEMARRRIDDFWFDMFNEVLRGLLEIERFALGSGSVKLQDWNTLARLPSSPSRKDIEETFYPGTPADVIENFATRGHSIRRANFLTEFDHAAYYQVYQILLKTPQLHFPDIQTLSRVGRNHGRIVAQVMIHVGQWLNLHPTQVAERDPNKPQLWRDLLPAFSEMHYDKAEELARQLQRQIFDILRRRIDELADGTPASVYLLIYPDSQGDAYLDRFIIPIWKDLLVTVYKNVGPRFKRSLVKFNKQNPEGLPAPQESTLTQAVRDAICRIPEIDRNIALRRPQALEALMVMISPVITTWVVKQSEDASKSPNLHITVPDESNSDEGYAVGTQASSTLAFTSYQAHRCQGGIAIKDLLEENHMSSTE